MTTQRSMDPILMVGSVVLLAAVLTWVLPAGRFERSRDPETGRAVVVPGSYKTVPRNPIGPWGVLMSIPQGLTEASAVVFYVFLTGGALTAIEATGAIGNTLDQLMRRFGNRPVLVLVFASALFLIGGASYGMAEEILALIPVLCALTRRLGLGNEMALGISMGTATVAGTFSPLNTFTLGISQPFAELPLFSGFRFRAVTFVLAMCTWGIYVTWYAARYRRLAGMNFDEGPAADLDGGKWKARDIAVLAALIGGIACLVLGAVFLRWDLPQFGAMFVGIGLVGGLTGGLGWRGTADQFAEGFRRLALAGVLVGFARAISVVLANGIVLDTIANALFSPLRHVSLSASSIMMLVSESALAFPMPSDSGRAMMSLPVLVPLADLLGLSRQVVVNSFLYSGLVGLITPTSGATLAMLALAGVSYSKWLRFVAVPFAILFALSAVSMVIGVKIGIQ